MTTFREELRAALDASMLTHTGRSIGDVASQRVIDDLWPLIEAREAALLAVVRRVAAMEIADDIYDQPFYALMDVQHSEDEQWHRDLIEQAHALVEQKQ